MPDAGWVGLDPTLGKPVGLRHVRVAYGRDYSDVAPVRGVYKGHAGQRLPVDVRVRPELNDEGHEQLSEERLRRRSLPPLSRDRSSPRNSSNNNSNNNQTAVRLFARRAETESPGLKFQRVRKMFGEIVPGVPAGKQMKLVRDPF